MTEVYRMKPITKDEQGKRRWQVEVNGQVINEVSSVRISNPAFGQLLYSMTPGGWDAWTFTENGGGGVVTLPFAIVDGRLMVGLVYQGRPLQGGKVWNAPRGFMNPGENNFQAATREIEEEIGWMSPDKRMKILEGEPANSNSAFFNTSEEGHGVQYYAMEVLSVELEQDEDSLLKFKDGIVKPVSKVAELIYSCRFMPWRQAAKLGDQFTGFAICRLLAAQLIGF